MPEEKKVNFHYIKSNSFRVIHVDGVFGGLTPTGDIFASLFSQRPPIPKLTVQEITENGDLGNELLSERVTRTGLVREIEVGVTIRPEIAESLIQWLQDKVNQYKKLRQEQDKKASVQ